MWNIIQQVLKKKSSILIHHEFTKMVNMNFLGFIMPLPYILFIILYPVNSNRATLLLSSFFLGLIMDLFSNSGGIHATACLVLAYYRPYLFKFAFGVSYEYQTVKLNESLTP